MRSLFIFVFAAFACAVAAPFAEAQGDVPAGAEFPAGAVFSEDHEPHELVALRDEPRREVQGSVEDSFYGIIHYDVYERAYLVEDFFPLGYRATVEYGYYPRLFETERGWEPRVSREAGAFFRGDEQIASYVKLFDEEGNQTAYTREGFSVVMPIMQALAAVLGIEFRDDL